MRSTLDIIIAVEECQPATDEELRLALMALSSIDRFIRGALDDLIEAIDEKKPAGLLGLKAHFAKQTRSSMFDAKKRDPAAWLGPGGIPGNPEHAERARFARSVAVAAGVLPPSNHGTDPMSPESH